MATDLDELIEPLKREVAVPGTFASVYKSTTNDDLLGSLGDAFSRAQLDGFFQSQVLDIDAGTVTPDLSGAGRAAVIIYAAESILTMKILELKQRVAYEAGPVKYETENAASVLTEVLRGMRLRRISILDGMESYRRIGTFAMQDMYADRVSGVEDVYIGSPSFYPYELAG